MKDKETPLKLVRLWPKMLPGCYETLEYLKDAKPEGQVDWPAYCEDKPLLEYISRTIGIQVE